MTPNSLPVTLSPTFDRPFTASVVDIVVVVISVVFVAVPKLLRSILAELQLLFEHTESFMETLSVDFPQPRSIWRLFSDVTFCLTGMYSLISYKLYAKL